MTYFIPHLAWLFSLFVMLAFRHLIDVATKRFLALNIFLSLSYTIFLIVLEFTNKATKENEMFILLSIAIQMLILIVVGRMFCSNHCWEDDYLELDEPSAEELETLGDDV